MKKNFIYSLCLSLLALFASVSAWAQQTVQGTVVDEAGQPVIGASVIVKGTTIGTTTGVDGKFQLAVPAKGELEVSFLGYIPETVADLSTAANVVLKEDKQQIEEVVVVGYGVQKKAHMTGSVASVPMDDIADISTGNLATALSGLMNGVSVSGGEARPGESASITIRNNGDLISGGVSPLYVIDGFILNASAFNNLDPASIESISVLKDASAAVYGSRAAGGVILVTTKKGKLGAPKISYSGTVGITDAVATPKMLSTYNYGRLWNAVRFADPTELDLNPTYDIFQKDELEAMRGLHYDLLDKYWKTAVTHQHSLNISGATEAASYFANISYFNQDGNLGKLDYDRWNFRAGVDVKVSKYLKASLQVSGDYGKTNKPLMKVQSSSAERDYAMLLTHPQYIPEEIDGKPIAAYGISNEELNATQCYNYGYLQNSSDYQSSMSQNTYINGALEYNFGWSRILKGLNLRLSYSKAISTTKSNEMGTQFSLYKLVERAGSGKHLYTPTEGNEQYYKDVLLAQDNFAQAHGGKISNGKDGGYIQRDMTRSDNYQLNFTASYARDFGKHSVSALFSIEKTESEYENVHAEGINPYEFSNGQSNSLNTAIAGDKTTSSTWGRSESGTLSYVGRLNYAYDDKYLLEFLIRSDASTKFAPENYWGYFPSLSAGWVISKENWFADNVKWVDFLKLRASFGLTGRDNIAAWQWMQTYQMAGDKGGVFGIDGPAGNHFQQGSAVNRGVKWDKSYKGNIGIDWNILNNRLGFTIEGYYVWDRDMLLKYKGSVPGTVGAASADQNYGKMDSYGVEFSATWRDRIGKDFKYRIQLNTGYSDNKVLEMDWPTSNLYRSVYKGHRTDMGTWGLQCIGMFRSFQDIEEYFEKYNITSYLGKTKDQMRPGMLIYKDIRSAMQPDGTYLGPDGNINDSDDLVRLSNRANPYHITLNLNAEWKGLSLTAQINASWGGYSTIPSSALNPTDGTNSGWNTLEYLNMPSFWNPDNMFVYQDIYDGAGNLTVAQNLDGHYPNLRYADVNSKVSTFWRVSGTRVTLNRLTLAYTLPQKWMNKIGISSCRINVTGQNLWSLYNPYPDNFIDPMMGYGAYPTLRKFTVGLNVTF